MVDLALWYLFYDTLNESSRMHLELRHNCGQLLPWRHLDAWQLLQSWLADLSLMHFVPHIDAKMMRSVPIVDFLFSSLWLLSILDALSQAHTSVHANELTCWLNLDHLVGVFYRVVENWESIRSAALLSLSHQVTAGYGQVYKLVLVNGAGRTSETKWTLCDVPISHLIESWVTCERSTGLHRWQVTTFACLRLQKVLQVIDLRHFAPKSRTCISDGG